MSVKCRLIDDFNAPKRVNSGVMHKTFRRNQIVYGVPVNFSMTPDNLMMALQTKEGFMIPEQFLNILSAPPNQEKRDRISSQKYDSSEIIEKKPLQIKKWFSKANGDSLSPKELVSDTMRNSKTRVNFALAGGLVALVYAMIKGKNKLIMTAIGGFVGAGAGTIYVNSKK